MDDKKKDITLELFDPANLPEGETVFIGMPYMPDMTPAVERRCATCGGPCWLTEKNANRPTVTFRCCACFMKLMKADDKENRFFTTADDLDKVIEQNPPLEGMDKDTVLHLLAWILSQRIQKEKEDQ